MIFVSEPRLSREQNVSWNLFESGRAGGGGGGAAVRGGGEGRVGRPCGREGRVERQCGVNPS